RTCKILPHPGLHKRGFFVVYTGVFFLNLPSLPRGGPVVFSFFCVNLFLTEFSRVCLINAIF
ncbi:hypothetical protein, partial [Enterobacter hormaechei]|uniref:hypothetical protein n=1 Tax=Enterobacter hormaechei TaxID=158836 RepID=UPI00194E4182